MRTIIKRILFLIRECCNYLYSSWLSGTLLHSLKSFLHLLMFHLFQAHASIRENCMHSGMMKKLQETSKGLYTLLPKDPRYTYSVLIPLHEPNPLLLKECIESVLNQHIPSLEIVIGSATPLSEEVKQIITSYPVRFEEKIGLSGSRSLVSYLAEIATGQFLLQMGDRDWLRPDFFLRYEQTLRIFSHPEKTVLYCNLNTLNKKGAYFELDRLQQPSELSFPFFFQQFLSKGLLIPAVLWKLADEFKWENRGAEEEDLLLRLDLAGAIFRHIPFELYFLREKKHPTIGKSQTAFCHVLEKYSAQKSLDWAFSSGYQNHTVRAIPAGSPSHSVQVIIPYKDQKDLTIKCIESILKQRNVKFKVTAIDNRSRDSSIGEKIQSMGGELLFVDEPFNYSRLNNLAVKQTKEASECDLLLFLNNDVELEPDALQEMVRWIDQPSVGMVGCRLHFPDGRLQHGGVNSFIRDNRNELIWEHIEKFRPFEKMNLSKNLGFFDAVTAACALIKRETFIAVGGFDEIWYPIGYSDTHLASKLSSLNLKCFYTPYAVGTHHESVSRKSSIEDFENSLWLHKHIKTKAPVSLT